MITYWTQVDVVLGALRARFYMADCAGKDQVVRAIQRSGWKGYEPPLPLLIARQSLAGKGVFIDVGANTGYYSLLAAACGASLVWAFEPMPDIRDLFAANIRESALTRKITVSHHALGAQAGDCDLYVPEAGHGLIETSASLNPSFRATHSGKVRVPVATLDRVFVEQPRWHDDLPVLMKIDVETLEAEVLKGGLRFIDRYRPTLVVELLPGADIDFFEAFIRSRNYVYFWLNPNNRLDDSGGKIAVSLSRRDHLFVPREQLQAFAQSMAVT